MPTATGPAWIGRYYGTQRFNGYIDEVRYWAGARTITDIQNNMFASCRSILPNANLVGAWNFDGNLINYSATSGIHGSFNTGGGNNLRFSAYVNEATTGPARQPLPTSSTPAIRLYPCFSKSSSSVNFNPRGELDIPSIIREIRKIQNEQNAK